MVRKGTFWLAALVAGTLAFGAAPDHGRMPPPLTAEGRPALEVRRPRDVFERRPVPADEPRPAVPELLVFFGSDGEY